MIKIYTESKSLESDWIIFHLELEKYVLLVENILLR